MKIFQRTVDYFVLGIKKFVYSPHFVIFVIYFNLANRFIDIPLHNYCKFSVQFADRIAVIDKALYIQVDDIRTSRYHVFRICHCLRYKHNIY